MRSRYLIALGSVAFVLFLSACRGPEIDNAQRSTLLGVWESALDGSTLSVYSNGAFTLEFAETATTPTQGIRGRMERGRDRVLVRYNPSANMCPDPGLYAFERTEMGLRFEVLEDDCAERATHLEHPWVLRERLPATPLPVR